MNPILRKILNKNSLSDESVNELSGGQINHTYQIGDDFVIKIQRDLDVLLHQVPLTELCLKVGAKVPKITDSGLIEEKEYIVMEKLPGKRLAEDWHIFSEAEKDNFIAQIAEQLKLFHSIQFNKYSPQRPKEFDNWKDAIINYTNFEAIDGKNFNRETKDNFNLIKNYFATNIDLLAECNSAVLVHNDIHFENILYEKDCLTGVFDFDFARQAPKDYELWHLIDFFRTPAFFVEEKLKPIWRQYSVGNELKLFKKYYPELFSGKNLLKKVRLYLIQDILSHAAAGYPDRSNEQINSYFKTNWLEEKVSI